MNIEQISNGELFSHMPFLVEDKQTFLFCLADERRIWKLHYCTDGSQPQRINTGFADDVVECSPVAWADDDGWHLSFVAGGGSPDPLFFLYRMDGNSLAELSEPEKVWRTKAGFVYKDVMAGVADRNTVCVSDPVGGDKEIEFSGRIIYRVSCRTDEPRKLLVSGELLSSREIFVAEHDLDTDEQSFLECDDGYPPYKCTINEEEIIYTYRQGRKFEERVLTNTKEAVRKPSSAGKAHEGISEKTRNAGVGGGEKRPCKNCRGL